MRRNRQSVITLALLIATAVFLPARVAAQAVTSDDLQRVQDEADRVAVDIAGLRDRDGALASDLQRQLDDVRDNVAYLRVKLRRNEPISDREYHDVRNRLDDLRRRARDAEDVATPSDNARTTLPPAEDDRELSSPEELPVGTEFDVRLQTSLSSATARVEDRFEATTVDDIRRGDRVIVPAGSVVHGIVNAVTKTTRLERTGKLAVVFDGITIAGRSYPVRGTVEQALQSEGIRGEAGKIGVGAAAGAIIGGLLGGAKGALAGVLIGGGGTLAATEGKDVDLPAGTVLRIRLDAPLDIERSPFN